MIRVVSIYIISKKYIYIYIYILLVYYIYNNINNQIVHSCIRYLQLCYNIYTILFNVYYKYSYTSIYIVNCLFNTIIFQIPSQIILVSIY